MIEHNIYNQNWQFIGNFYSSKPWTNNYCKTYSKANIIKLLNLDNEIVRGSKYFFIKPLI